MAVPEDVSYPHTIKVRESLWTRLRHQAIDQGKTVSELVDAALVKLLDKPDEEGR